ncbi:MAG: hypothetical protein ACRBF0_25115 [Calditrichia bacterium]
MANSHSTDGVDWIKQHLDTFLPQIEQWLKRKQLPEIYPWDGVERDAWTPGIPLDFDATHFAGINSLSALGNSLRRRFELLNLVSGEFEDKQMLAYSYCFWGYLKWADQVRQRYVQMQAPTATMVPLNHDSSPKQPTIKRMFQR